MARKSKVSQEAANEDGDVIKAAIREIEKKYGKGTVIDLKGGALDVEGIHSGSLALDAALGGKGLPKGRLIELFGGESSSKTTLALKCVADFQKQGGSVAYIDAEHAIDPEWAEDKLGVNMAQERFFFFQPGTAEESLDIVQMSIETLGCKLVVVDSVAALVPKAELEGDMGQAHVGLLARQMGQACRKLKKLVADTGAIVIFINQIRDKVGTMGFGDPTTTPGGRALKFFSSVRIKTARIQTLKDSSGDPSGIVVKAKVIKNKIAPPFREATFEVHGDCGISRELELIDAGLAAKVITKSGSWHDFEGTKIGSSRLNARIFLEDNPDVAKKIEDKILKGAANENSGESEAASGDGDA